MYKMIYVAVIQFILCLASVLSAQAGDVTLEIHFFDTELICEDFENYENCRSIEGGDALDKFLAESNSDKATFELNSELGGNPSEQNTVFLTALNSYWAHVSNYEFDRELYKTAFFVFRKNGRPLSDVKFVRTSPFAKPRMRTKRRPGVRFFDYMEASFLHYEAKTKFRIRIDGEWFKFRFVSS